MMGGYGTLATEVYDVDKPIGHSFGDVEFYLHVLDGIDGRVLEPAVGTGRMLIPLLEAGLTVDGFDNSPEMLAVCRQRCIERDLDPILFDADMTSFESTEAYSAVIVPTGSIALLDGRTELMHALTRFQACLEPGGRLLLDVNAPRLSSEPEPMRTWAAGRTVWTLRTMRIEYDAAKKQTTRWLRYEKWIDGVVGATELQVFRLQHWSVSEFSGLLREAGFVNIALTSDYAQSGEPSVDSDIWTFAASNAP
jgi:SAM-dependent methyltransferase